MFLTAGTRLGPYEILAFIGAGGMGEVYRARDTKLGREVAIKVLRQALLHDRESLARFEREARLLATLNHPNIAAIYGFEESNGVQYLVLELVPGKTLAELLTTGPLNTKEALSYCRQIAGALEAAHEKGMVHRDLKPANVKVTPEGIIKVLDFGLAKVFEVEEDRTDISGGTTDGGRITDHGIVLGTTAYMSPEQARGKEVDKRTDIWSFGCVLYEALTGRQAFEGATVSDTIAMILGRDPDWQPLTVTTPVEVIALLRRCLQKDLSRRLRDMGDVRLEIDELLEPSRAMPPIVEGTAGSLAARKARAIAWGLAILTILTIGVVWEILVRPTPVTRPMARVVVTLPPGDRLVPEPTPVLSPDGSRLVYVANHAGSSQLYLRSIDRFEATAISGTQDAESPFFSPDGQSVGFFADGKLKKVSLSGGMPITLCGALDNRGASWGPDNTIIFAPSSAVGLFRVPAVGGAPQPVTVLDEKKGELSHRWPEILPGGKAVLFTIWTGTSFDDARIGIISLETGQQRVLVEGGTYARYVSSGYLVFARGGGLLAAPFDLKRLQITGAPEAVLEDVAMYPGTGTADFSVSAGGLLVYIAGGPRVADRTLLWVDRNGMAQQLPAPSRPYTSPRLSPDGQRLSVGLQGSYAGVWIYDLSRGTLTRVIESGGKTYPIWTPDGKYLTFVSPLSGSVNLQSVPIDGSAVAERLSTSKNPQLPGSWSPDGRVLAFSEQDPTSGWDIWVLAVQGGRQVQPFLKTPFNEGGGIISPDGQWLAYQSDESGREEIYVRAFRGPGGKQQISVEGGGEPVWARNGRELFYRNGDEMMAAAVETKPRFSAARPKLLFEGKYETGVSFLANYDISPDGLRFLMIRANEQESVPTQLNVIFNWSEDLKRRVPADR